jgi:hypothetical protein
MLLPFCFGSKDYRSNSRFHERKKKDSGTRKDYFQLSQRLDQDEE